MKNNQIQNDLLHIRTMMERSSRFLSLSGLAGVFAGFFAILGALFAYFILQKAGIEYFEAKKFDLSNGLIIQLFAIAMTVLLLSISVALLLTYKKSKSHNTTIWNTTTRKMLRDFFVPLASGGIVCLALIYNELYVFLAPTTLIFYGIALYFSERYTFNDIAYLGLSNIALGLISLFFLGYGLLFWALGFGVLHLIYGTLMHKKYK